MANEIRDITIVGGGPTGLFTTGYAEAAIAVNNAVHYVNPEARVNPGHSTNMKTFKD